MTHLPKDELAEALGPDASPRATLHLAECEVCRRLAEDLRSILAVLRAVDVPEPSPLFWSSFSGRVSRATASSDPARAPWRRLPRPGFSPKWSLAAAMLVFGAAAFALLRPGAVLEPPRPVPAEESAIVALPAAPESSVFDGESPWALVADASGGMDWEVASAAGFSPSPGSAERAVSQLSDLERRELMKLLKAELAGPSL